MSSNFISTNMFNLDAVQFKAPDEQKNKFSKKIFINDTSKARNQQALKITLPRLYTFGLQTFKDDEEKFSVSIQFPMEGHGVRTQETESALQELLAFENKIIDHMTYKSANYFGKTCSKETIKSMYRPFIRFPKKTNNDREIDYETPPYIPCRIQYYAKDRTYRNLHITDEKNKNLFTSPSKSSPKSLVEQGHFVDCEIYFSKLWYNNDSFGVEFFATQIKVHSTQEGLVQEIVEKKKVEKEVVIEVVEEEEEVEEYEEYVVHGNSYYIQNKNHGSFIYKDGETEDEIGEEVGVFVNGVPRFFQQYINITAKNGKVVKIERRP